MTPERHQQIAHLYHDALALEPEERAAFLDQLCADDESLRQEVESLLAVHAEAEGFLSAPALEVAAEGLAEEQAGAHGRRLGHYRLLALLGAGGMGEVHLAEDTRLGRKLALKLLPAAFTTDAVRVGRFAQEARAASSLNHPNIITIYEVGEAEGTHYIATEFVDGQTLRARLAGERLSLSATLEIAVQVASALSAAHEAGIIHRDIKPENVMVRRDGLVKVLDFGLAKLTERPASVLDTDAPTAIKVETDTGTVLGTASYMSPEQARGLKVDTRTDIFSLGVVLYEMIAGRAPFAGQTTMDVLAAILDREPPPLARYAPEAPAELQRIVSKALRKEREERYQGIRDLLLDLKSLKQELELDARDVQRGAGEERRDANTGEQAATTATAPVAQTGEAGVARRTSSAEYLVSQVKGHPRGALLALTVLLVGLMAAVIYFVVASRSKPPEAGSVVRSIAVLPFKPISAAQRDEILELGMADTLITKLSNLRQIIVRPTSAVRKYTKLDQDPVVAGRELKVDSVLEGSVQKSGQRIRVTVRLVRVRDGAALWAGQFDEKSTDIFAVQTSISEQATSALAVQLTGAQKALLAKRYTENTAAYELYLKGRFWLSKRTEEGLKKGIKYFEEAIAQDPRYALAYAGLSDGYNLLAGIGLYSPKEVYPKAKAAVTRALQIDDTLAEAHASLGPVKLYYDWDWSGAESEYQRALELNPNYATAHQWYAEYLMTMGRFAEAIREMKRAQELDPFSLTINTNVGWVFYFARQYDQAIEAFRKALELEPNFAYAHSRFSNAYAAKGMYGEAVNEYLKSTFSMRLRPGAATALREAYGKSGWSGFLRKQAELEKEAAKQTYVSPYRIAMLYALLGEKDQAFAWLEKAYEERSLAVVRLKVDPTMDSLRADPRFANLLRRVGLAQ